jgi:hypothetical protein
MTTKVKVLIGGILGMLTMSFISSTYFYTFVNKVMRGLRENLKDYNY